MNGSITLTTTVPSCAYQIDAFYGKKVLSGADLSNGLRYGPRKLDALIAGPGYGGSPPYCTPVATTTPSPSATATETAGISIL